MEQQPLRFIDREMLPLLVKSARCLASHIGCDADEIALLPNVTAGLNSVVNTVAGRVEKRERAAREATPGRRVVSLDIGYGSVRRMLERWRDKAIGLQWTQIEVPLPFTNEELCRIVEEELRSGDVELLVVDHVTSNSAVVLPVQELSRIAHQSGAQILVDGAHALGSLCLDMHAIDADYYVGNCHKWFLCPRGAGFFYCSSKGNRSSAALADGGERGALRDEVEPPIVSHGFRHGFASRFIWDGARDYSAALCIPSAVTFWGSTLGGAAAMQYCKETLSESCRILTESWTTDTLFPLEMCASMAVVRIPRSSWPRYSQGAVGEEVALSSAAKAIQDALFHAHHIEVPVKSLSGELYVRISAHVYNHVAQYERLADAVLALRWDSPL